VVVAEATVPKSNVLGSGGGGGELSLLLNRDGGSLEESSIGERVDLGREEEIPILAEVHLVLKDVHMIAALGGEEQHREEIVLQFRDIKDIGKFYDISSMGHTWPEPDTPHTLRPDDRPISQLYWSTMRLHVPDPVEVRSHVSRSTRVCIPVGVSIRDRGRGVEGTC
jgi:hypothetical protein